MTDTGLLASWVTWTPLERAAVRSVYFHQRGLADTAHRNVVRVQDVSRALQAAYHRVAALILESEPDGGTAETVRVTAAVRGLAELRTAS